MLDPRQPLESSTPAKAPTIRLSAIAAGTVNNLTHHHCYGIRTLLDPHSVRDYQVMKLQSGETFMRTVHVCADQCGQVWELTKCLGLIAHMDKSECSDWENSRLLCPKGYKPI